MRNFKLRILVFAFCFMAGRVAAQLAAQPEDISPLKVGEQFPDATLTTIDGTPVSFKALLKDKTIVIFYRGSWCPYCNMHLAEVGQIEGDLLALGYQILAVSPDGPEELSESMTKDHVHYTLLSDRPGVLIRAAGLAYQAPGIHRRMLGDIQETEDPILPVPALFIVDAGGTILYEYISPSYKVRISGDSILRVARTLAENR